jgi:hypothetical protein
MQHRALQKAVFVAMVLALGACGGGNGATSSPDAAAGDGVNDVLLACQQRAQWANATASSCNTCMAYAEEPRCACADVDYAGKCSAQQAARTSEPTCDGVSTCLGACARTDCACQDACYAGKPACRTVASAADGCLASVCEPYCK